MLSKRGMLAGAVALSGALCAGQALAQDEVVPTSPAPVEQPAEQVAEQAAERRIDILNYRVQGNTVLTRMDIEKAVYGYLGPQRPIGDVELARAALEQAYRAKGYETVGVDIPEQDVRKGVVVFNVVELKVGRLRVVDSTWYSPEDIKARAPSLAEGQVPNYTAVAKDLADLNKVAGRTITPTLRAGHTPGTVDVDLTVEDTRPAGMTLELNDRYSNRTARLRASVGLNYTNLFQREHTLSLQAQFAPEAPEQTWVVSASYLAPITGTPFSLIGYGVHSSSDVAAVGGIGVIGSGDIFGVRVIANLPTSGPWVQQVLGGVDYKSFNEELVLGSDSAATPIDYAALTVGYSASRITEGSRLDLAATLNFGLRGIGATDSEYRLKRFMASASWSYLKLDASYSQLLPAGFTAIGKVSSQITGAPLISNEQFGAGGADSVRGYYESQELGDYGVQGQLQLETPSLAKGWGGEWVNDWRIYAFSDAALLRVHDPLPIPLPPTVPGGPSPGVTIINEYKLMSVGVGSRIRFLKHYNIDLLLAAPLIDEADTKTDIDGKIRGQFRIWSEF